jgi:hypothetical protein
MASTFSNNDVREHRKYFSHNSPFNIQVPSSLRDPNDTTFSINELEQLKTINDARNVALEYLHNHEEFALFWNSNKPYPETRRLMRKLIQIQTINAVCNGFERKIRLILF